MLFWLGAALAALLLFAHRHSMNADGISYIEVGESWLRGDFRNALNGYWSPVYSIFAALSTKLVPKALDPIGPHILNFILFVSACFAFRSFVQRLAEVMLPAAASSGRKLLYSVATAVFLWSMIRVNELVELIPDPIVFILVLLAAAQLVSLQKGGFKNAALFGLLLGVAYLTKSVMLPLGLVFLVASVFMAKPFGRAVRLTACATVVFLSVTALYVVPLSIQKQRFTSGDSGALAYAWEVNGFGPFFHWQGNPPGSGTPKNPTHQILKYPPTYEFDSGAPGTYPLFRDPSFWNEGMHPRFNLRDQIKRLGRSAKFYRENVVREPILIALFFSLLIGGTAVGWKKYWQSTKPLLPLILAGLAPFALYSLVYIDFRYLAPFLLLVVVGLLTGYLRARGTAGPADLRWARLVTGFICFFLVCATLFASSRAIQRDRWNSYKVHEKIANALAQSGVGRGAKLAVIGRGNSSFFVRILRGQIIAEALIFPGHPEWPLTLENINKIAAAVKQSTQAVAIVSMGLPVEGGAGEWTRVEDTQACFRVFQRQ